MRTSAKVLSALALMAVTSAANAVSITTSGYSESFDSMTATGTTAPAGWRVLTGASGSSNNTWTNATGILATDVAAMVATTNILTANNAPTTTNNNGFNAANGSIIADRLLATSPTSVSGSALDLTLNNGTGFSFNQILVSYDTRRYTTASTANDLPGYQLFYSLNNISWTNVVELNPTLTTVPNTVGITSVTNATVNLSSSVATGADFYLRWVDDNATQTSPDQIIGLNNVLVTAVPEPETYAMLMAGLGLIGFAARRNVKA